ncbi:hypothetical protein K438DRAFT_105838 [Mycena galopus ATCC 62051]|nr:hypothetical protein K438DRAFT_105838 [Mycena galopus ATCC 62051]
MVPESSAGTSSGWRLSPTTGSVQDGSIPASDPTSAFSHRATICACQPLRGTSMAPADASSSATRPEARLCPAESAAYPAPRPGVAIPMCDNYNLKMTPIPGFTGLVIHPSIIPVPQSSTHSSTARTHWGPPSEGWINIRHWSPAAAVQPVVEKQP